MKRTPFIIAVLIIGLAACGESKPPESQVEAPKEEQATEADMQLLQETESVKAKVHEVNETADSILNNL